LSFCVHWGQMSDCLAKIMAKMWFVCDAVAELADGGQACRRTTLEGLPRSHPRLLRCDPMQKHLTGFCRYPLASRRLPPLAAAHSAPRRRPMSASAAVPEVAVLMCGLPGRMGHSVAEAVVRRWGADALLPFSPTGQDVALDSVDVAGKGAVELLRPDSRDAAWARVEEAAAGRLIVAADYTHPDAAVENCAWYRTKNVPFVMGTTGYDTEAARAAIGPDLYAVLAPNMGKPIVLFQAMLEHAACAPTRPSARAACRCCSPPAVAAIAHISLASAIS
jgi:hypothetical protein